MCASDFFFSTLLFEIGKVFYLAIWQVCLPGKFTLRFAFHLQVACVGAQWLSGRALDSRPRGHWFEPHRRHCVVLLEQDTFILA